MAGLRILLLGGTTEASALTRSLVGDARFDATLSLAGATRAPAPSPLPRRIGGFGGIDGLLAWLRDHRTEALIDATHSFATRISAHAAAAAERADIPRLLVCRPPWTPKPGDRWTHHATLEDAAAALGPAPRRVLLTIGRKDLGPFAARPWHRYLIRSVDAPPPDTLPPGATVIAARGPFDLAAECALLRAHAIDVLVTKNSGGSATAAKLEAARALGIPVAMIDRPPQPAGQTVPDAEAALAWLAALHHATSSEPGATSPAADSVSTP